MNNEQILAHHLYRKGLFDRVKRFPNVMYLAREVNDYEPTWSWGQYELTVGYYVKHVSEYRTATTYAMRIRSREDWERGDWRQFDSKGIRDYSPPFCDVSYMFGRLPIIGSGQRCFAPIAFDASLSSVNLQSRDWLHAAGLIEKNRWMRVAHGKGHRGALTSPPPNAIPLQPSSHGPVFCAYRLPAPLTANPFLTPLDQTVQMQ